MGLFKKEEGCAAISVQTRPEEKFTLPIYSGERELYKVLRESVPIIDAAIYKLKRLIGSFKIISDDEENKKELDAFLRNVKVNSTSSGIDAFIGIYFEELLTYGNAIGEIVLCGDRIAGLYNASLDNVEIEEKDVFENSIYLIEGNKKMLCKYPDLLLFSALNPEAGKFKGTSLLRGLPFVSQILMKIYKTIGVNWDRLGNVRFAVTCKPDSSGAYAAERAKQMATEWKRAMRGGQLSDFIAVGDVSIKAIGADNVIADTQVPVRQMLEQIVSKLGVPPFLLGLTWSSTERMSSQQADMLTTELDAYRSILSPVIRKICDMYLRFEGIDLSYEINWDEITMQDEVDHAEARYKNAQADKIEMEINEERG